MFGLFEQGILIENGAYRCRSQNKIFECLFEFNTRVTKAYRYFDDEKYAKELVDEGKIRLGHLFRYHRIEGDSARGDSDEGFVFSSGIASDGSPIAVCIVSVDSWILCLSDTLSAEISEDFKARTVVEIDLLPFLFALAESMAEVAHCGEVFNVNYMSFLDLVARPSHPLPLYAKSIKNYRFSNQKEIRASFEPRSNLGKGNGLAELSDQIIATSLEDLRKMDGVNLPPHLGDHYIKNADLTKYCRIVKLD